jgi:hypothetical protein
MKRYTTECKGLENLRHRHLQAHLFHPVHWLMNHPMLLAFLLAGAIVLLVIALTALVDTGIRPETLGEYNFYAGPFDALR